MKNEDFEEIKNYFLDLKRSVFYLSYQEEVYLNYILDKKIPKNIIMSGINKYMSRLPEFKKRKAFLFMCDKDIESYSIEFIKRMWSNSNDFWYISRLHFHIDKIKSLGLDKKYNIDLKNVDISSMTEEKAQTILSNIKKHIFDQEWKKLDKTTKDQIMAKYQKFKNIKELYEKIIIDDVLGKLNLNWIDLYSL